MYLTYGEYGIIKQQEGQHYPLLEVDDNGIWKYTSMEAMILVPQLKTRQSDFRALSSSSLITVQKYFYIKSCAKHFIYKPCKWWQPATEGVQCKEYKEMQYTGKSKKWGTDKERSLLI